ncbi:hypothetical protein KDA_17050 [Dictyobacter alpinus]|uniref:Uncharacterized protein n=1 Tax=Dictyobacter alpinus TaxID=2014873 RepID=A0A402B4F1_9CHLR|nr:hypothetical protein KDA_17050 [Dictyobacter alpinus]
MEPVTPALAVVAAKAFACDRADNSSKNTVIEKNRIARFCKINSFLRLKETVSNGGYN